MTDEKLPEEIPADPEVEIQETSIAELSPKSPVPPAAAWLAFVMIALLGALIAMGLKNGFGHPPIENTKITALQAELAALRGEQGDSEPLEDIAGRLKKDADSFVALAGNYQKILAEKDGEIIARSAELLKSEKLRQSLAAEISRNQGDLQRALVSGSESAILRRDLADLKAQRDSLTADLADAREKLKTLSNGIPADDYADLKRRFDETLRAKEFFENRVKELEGDSLKPKE